MFFQEQPTGEGQSVATNGTTKRHTLVSLQKNAPNMRHEQLA